MHSDAQDTYMMLPFCHLLLMIVSDLNHCLLSPMQIVLECLLASLLCIFGMVSVTGKFKDIKLTMELNSRTFETVSNRPGFMIFNHRGPIVHDVR